MDPWEELFIQTEEVEVYPGKIVTGEVISKDEDGVYVGFGYRHDGFIPYAEYAVDACYENVEIGVQVEAKVMQCSTKTDVVRMSKIKAEVEAAWKNIMPLVEDEKRVEKAQVVRVIKKKAQNVVGLEVRICGVYGFMPSSHVAVKYPKDFSIYIGQEFDVEIISIDIEKKNIVVSRKNILNTAKDIKYVDEQGVMAKQDADLEIIINILKESKNSRSKNLKIKELTSKNQEDKVTLSIGDLIKLTDECMKKGIAQGRIKTIVNIAKSDILPIEKIINIAVPEEAKRNKVLEIVKNKL